MRESDLPYQSFEITTNWMLSNLILVVQVEEDLRNIPIFGGAQNLAQSHYFVAATMAAAGVVAAAVERVGSSYSMAQVQTITTSMEEMCDTADWIVAKMSRYSLLKNNCQHFCNNFLAYYNLPTSTPTAGPKTTTEM